VTSKWLANAILQGIEVGILSLEDLHFGVDQTIWDRLSISQNPLIEKQMQMIRNPNQYFHFVHPMQANIFIKFRCRGIDPWMKKNRQLVRLTSLNPTLSKAFQRTKQQSIKGWPVKILHSEGISSSQNSEPISPRSFIEIFDRSPLTFSYSKSPNHEHCR
jgi:hypothetical protein